MPRVIDRIRNSGVWPLARTILLEAVFVFALIKFASVVHTHYPIHKWLFWRHARAWGLASLWTFGCLVAGHALLRKLLRGVRPILEHLVLSFAVGLFSFFLLMVVCGLLHLYGPVLFIALPLAMIAAGAWPAWRYARRLVRHVRFARSRAAPRPRWWNAPLLFFGFLGTVAVYLPVLLPDNAAFDACWYHLPIAEHYVAAGGLVPFREGWHLGAFPQLASLLYTWAFLEPLTVLFDRVELCAHLEFVVFLWTLASIPLLVRKLVPRSRASWSWLVMYLFPGLFVYDSSLVLGADHIAAFWAVPVYVALLRMWRTFEPRWALLTAVFVSAAFDTKYTAFVLAVGTVAAIAARFLVLWLRSARDRVPGCSPARAWAGLAVFATAGVLLTAPHWAKNWAFYGDPLYPALWRHLPVHPWTADSALRYAPENWAPTRDLAGLWKTVQALWNFSFVPNDWEEFHGKVPVFGSLFTLTLLALPLVRGTKRICGLAAVTLAGVFAWYTVSHQDRYLQVLVPWMAACAAALLTLVWRSGWIARAAVVPVVALQLIWGMIVYFIPSHAMLVHHPLRVLSELGGAWFRKEYDERLDLFLTPSGIGKVRMSKADVVLVHEKLNHVGLRSRSVSDHPRFQSGISYSRLGSPREVFELFRQLEVTHLLLPATSVAADSYSGDLVFWDFAQRYTHDRKTIGGLAVVRMPSSPPPAKPFGDVVAFFACRADLGNGLYHLNDLNRYPLDTTPAAGMPRPFEEAAVGSERDQQMLRADFLIHDTSCQPRLPENVASRFISLVPRDAEHLYVMKTSP